MRFSMQSSPGMADPGPRSRESPLGAAPVLVGAAVLFLTRGKQEQTVSNAHPLVLQGSVSDNETHITEQLS